MSSNLVELIEPSIIGDLKSYWAMHFCSILETLYEHKQLEFNLQQKIPQHQPRTLSNFVGTIERGFFARIREHVNNWGLQYFLCHYLMSSEGESIFKAIVNEVSNNYSIDLLQDMESYGVFVCGIDSYSGEQFLKNTNAEIFGYTEKTIQNVWEDIKYVDLCILIKRQSNNNIDSALLGEVEGNKAAKLLGKSFWEKKPSLCLFGIGVKKGEPNIARYNVRYGEGVKTVITLGSNYPVIDDFQVAIGIMEIFLSMNHQHKISKIPGQIAIVDIIRDYWYLPIDKLIIQLRSLIRRVETATMGTNDLTITTVPKIVT